MTISYSGEYRETAPLRLLRQDPNDKTKWVIYNTKNGMVDNGDSSKEPLDHCYNCNTPDSLHSSVSLHYCKCGVIFNYWAGGGNEKWNKHYKKMNEVRDAMTWYGADDYT